MGLVWNLFFVYAPTRGFTKKEIWSKFFEMPSSIIKVIFEKNVKELIGIKLNRIEWKNRHYVTIINGSLSAPMGSI